MERTELLANIQSAVADVLKTGNSAPKVYIRIQPTGDVDVREETSWCCSSDEYYKRVPHTLSLEIGQGERDYSMLDDDQIEECACNAEEAAEEWVNYYLPRIDAWIAAGNFSEVE